MKKEIFCSACGRKFAPTGREHICPACKEAAAQEAKRAAVERAKMRSYTGEACPVRISAKARGFIEAVAKRQGCKFIPALDKVLQDVASKYGFSSWDAVPEHKTARRRDKHTEVKQDVQDVPQDKQDGAQATSKQASKPQEVTKAAKKAVKTTTGKASKASKAGKE